MTLPGKSVVCIAAAALLGCASGGTTNTASSGVAENTGRPGLVVLVVVDQLRADLLDRYGDLFTGGFKRLRTEGHSYVNASHAHGVTVTAAGHATLSTGSFPSHHGVIANAWAEKAGDRWVTVENIQDTTVKIIGFPNETGASPVHLMRSGLAEWVANSNPASIVASISGKDRGAIQPAAHAKRGYVYWFEGVFGRFVTSTYYRKSDPSWVTQFNSTVIPKYRADSVWNLSVPASARSRADRDSSTNEADGVNIVFPHRYASREGANVDYWVWFENTPAADALTLDMAEQAVTSLQLGRDAAPDFLNVSLSVTDRVGHRFGPLSLEQMDNLIKLDRELGEFLTFLDNHVGKDRYVVVLSADHGALDAPEDLVARGEYGHRITPAESKTLDSLRAIADANPDKKAAARTLVAELKKLPIIGDAWTKEELAAAQSDSFAVLMQRSMYPGRESGRFSRQGVEFRYVPGVYAAPRGSGHGQPYWYDRHVPLIFMGAGIPAGNDPYPARTVDFAPTAAAILGIQYPSNVDGKPLSGIVSR
ncbi:MAG TPA: alkaline phosphatase family protein [Gemmatimonadaceae bacterium]